jgi:hypothetical protein
MVSPSLSSAIVACLLVTSGCAGLTSPGAASHVRLDSPPMRQFAVAGMTDLERDVRLDTGERGAKATPAVYWAGIGAGTVGAAGGLAFGIAGFVAKNQVTAGYQDQAGMSLAERDRLVSNGNLYNTLSISFTALSVVGFAAALVAYGVDWNRCGPLAPERRRCSERAPASE